MITRRNRRRIAAGIGVGLLSRAFTAVVVVADGRDHYSYSWRADDTDTAAAAHVVETTTAIEEDVAGAGRGRIVVEVPSHSPGDLLFLFLSRTDGLLPLEFPGSGWKRVAECFKTDNHQDRCWEAEDCTDRLLAYCLAFDDEEEYDDDEGLASGQDLATVVFYREAKRYHSKYVAFPLLGNSTAWAVLTSLSGVDPIHPVRSVATVACDLRSRSEFPSVEGRKDDVLLLSMAFDDAADEDDFKPPDGTELLGHVQAYDEAAFLFGATLTEDGPTGERTTGGDGGSQCKDALIALTLRPASSVVYKLLSSSSPSSSSKSNKSLKGTRTLRRLHHVDDD